MLQVASGRPEEGKNWLKLSLAQFCFAFFFASSSCNSYSFANGAEEEKRYGRKTR